MIVGYDIAVFGNEEAGTLSDRTFMTGARATLAGAAAIRASVGTCIATRVHAEITEEALQRMIVRKLIKPGRARELATATAISSLLHVLLYTNADDSRTNLLNKIGKTRSLRWWRYLHGFRAGVIERTERAGRDKTTGENSR